MIQESSLRVGVDSRPAEEGARRSTRALDSVSGAAQRTERQLGGITRTALGVGAALAGVAGGAAAFSNAISTLAGFEQGMSTVRAVTRATETEMRALRAEAQRLGASTRFSATQATEGLLYLARAGFDAREAMGALEGTLTLAQAGALDLGLAADIASNVLTGFRLEVSETSRVVDVLAYTANSANTDVAQLGDALKFVAPVAAGLGIELEETAAAVAQLSNAGLQASMAGTGLRRVLTGLENATPKAERALARYGLSIEDVRPSTVGLTGALFALADAGVSTADLLTTFGDRGGPASQVLTTLSRDMAAFAEELDTVSGEAARVSAIMDDNLNGALLSVRSALEAVVLGLGEAGATDALESALRGTAVALRLVADNADLLGVALVALGARGVVPVAGYLVTALAPAAGTASVALQLLAVRGGAALVSMQLLRGGLALLGGPLGIAALATTAVVVAFMRMETASQRVEAQVSRANEAFEDSTGALREANAILRRANPLDDMRDSAVTATAEVEGLRREFEGLTTATLMQAQAEKTLQVNRLMSNAADVRDAMAGLAREREQLVADTVRATQSRNLRDAGQRGPNVRAQVEVDLADDLRPLDAQLAGLQNRLTDLEDAAVGLMDTDLRTFLSEVVGDLEDLRGGGGETNTQLAEFIQGLAEQERILQTARGLEREIVTNLLSAGLDAEERTTAAARAIVQYTTSIYELEEAEQEELRVSEQRVRTLADYTREVLTSINALNLEADARQSRIAAQRVEEDLARSQIEYTQAEIEALEALYLAHERGARVVSQADTLQRSLLGGAREYTETVAALNYILAQNPELQAGVNRELEEAQHSFLQMQASLADASFADTFLAGLSRMSEGARTVAQTMGQNFETFFSSLSSGFGDSVGRAVAFGDDLGASLENVARGAVAQLVSSLVQIGVQMLINRAIGQAVAASATAASAAEAATLAAAWAPAAANASLATLGANAAAAAVGIASTHALTQSLSMFKQGGWTGDGNPNDLVGGVHAKEFVVKAPYAQQNRAMLEAINAGQTPRAATSSRAAPATSGGAGGDTYSIDLSVIVQAGDTGDAEEIASRTATRIKETLARVVDERIMFQKRTGGLLAG